MTDNLNEDSILIWDEPEVNLNPKDKIVLADVRQPTKVAGKNHRDVDFFSRPLGVWGDTPPARLNRLGKYILDKISFAILRLICKIKSATQQNFLHVLF